MLKKDFVFFKYSCWEKDFSFLDLMAIKHHRRFVARVNLLPDSRYGVWRAKLEYFKFPVTCQASRVNHWT